MLPCALPPCIRDVTLKSVRSWTPKWTSAQSIAKWNNRASQKCRQPHFPCNFQCLMNEVVLDNCHDVTIKLLPPFVIIWRSTCVSGSMGRHSQP